MADALGGGRIASMRNTRRVRIHSLVIVSLLIACGAPPSEPAPLPPPPPAPPVEPEPAPTPAADPTAEPVVDPAFTAPPAPSTADRASLAAGLRDFTARLHHELAVPAAQSAAIAPVSVAAALSMTAAGGRGPAADEVWAGLGIASLGERAPGVVAGALGALVGDELSVANRLFAAEQLAVEPPFVELTGSLFGAPIERVDFAAPDVAITRINAWVSERTHARIPEILPGGSVTGDTRLVLVNAMYFLAAWQTEFDEARTTDDYFAAPSGRVTCRMMNRRGRAALGEADGARVLRLPYAGDRFVATFVLPDEGTELSALEATMTGEILGHWLEAPQARGEVIMEIPRFRVASDAPVSLTGPLDRMGMHTMFTASADFTGIAPAIEALYVSDVFHRVFVETTERGTEAAAATAVSMARGTGLAPAAPRFRADRPFLFVITDAESGLVLFFARVATPGAPE